VLEVENMMTSSFETEAEEFAAIARELATQPGVPETLDAIVRYAAERVEGAEEAGITVVRGDSWKTVAATSDVPLRVDEIQYRTQEGPCLDSINEHHVFRTNNLADDDRWPRFGRQAADETEIVSMLSHRLYLDDEKTIGALNLYSRLPAAFDGHSMRVLNALATHSAIALAKADAEKENENLQHALSRNRHIGMAIGILMATHKVTDQQAFDLLRIASQANHRKLYDIALDVVDTGSLDL
jgi:GAF domain-containing protein